MAKPYCTLIVTYTPGDTSPVLNGGVITVGSETHQRLMAECPEFADWYKANGEQPYYMRCVDAKYEDDESVSFHFEVWRHVEAKQGE